MHYVFEELEYEIAMKVFSRAIPLILMGALLAFGISRLTIPLVADAQASASPAAMPMQGDMMQAGGSANCPMMNGVMQSARGPADHMMMSGMMSMNHSMAAMHLSGNADKDFMVMMIPHHQAAIDMAKAELEYGKDPRVLGLAKSIIAAQQKEIDEMRAWLK